MTIRICLFAAAWILFALAPLAAPADAENPTIATNVTVKFASAPQVAEADLPFPSEMECAPRPVYRLRTDGQPGPRGHAQLQTT